MPGLSSTLILNEDVVIAPVGDLGDDIRAQIECAPSDFAVSRVHGRSGSSIIDADAAQLLTRFREPRTVVEAVILFARERSLDPDAVLDDAYPLLRGMIERRVLISADKKHEADPAEHAWDVGTKLPVGTITRTLQVLEDTEVYLVTRADGVHAVLKIERTSTPAATAALRARLAHEAALLAYLDGRVAAKLLGQGEIEGRSYLLLEYLAGTDAESAAAQVRTEQDERSQRSLLELIRRVAAAYVTLHELGILHGDVHPRNVIVDREGDVRLIDFGLARTPREALGLPTSSPRGGIPFFFEPELARAFLSGSTPPATSPAGEQFAVGALLYSLAAGAHWQNFRLGREDMLRDIVERAPLSFAERGIRPWPALERALTRALSKDASERFPSMAAFATALPFMPPPSDAMTTRRVKRARGDASEHVLERVLPDGPLTEGEGEGEGITEPPTASVTYGAAGIAVGLLQVAQRRGDARILAGADVWARKATGEIGRETGFYNSEIQITRDMVGEASPYHSPSGVHAASALIARAMGDPVRQVEAVEWYLEAARHPAAGLDLTVGRASTLLGAAILLDAAPTDPRFDVTALRSFGDTTVREIWEDLDRKRPIIAGDVEYLGIAHGWAGFIYATLQWCRLASAPVPPGVERRLGELGTLALPSGRGLEWPWVLRSTGEPPTMPGWCNGSAGYVFLWTLASRMFGGPHYMNLAVGAAWNAWESAEPAGTICCGLAGRGYALLNLYRATGDRVWVDRARSLATRASRAEAVHAEYAHSLYKGELGVAVLSADLEEPDEAAMPFFEPVGYRSA
jgi:eukaryotic-like serine/threonine-protein kinase